jgi:hypothetical protein
MRYIFLVLLIASGISCRRDNSASYTDITDWFQIEIKAQRNIDCGLPEIIFLDHQSIAYEIIGDKKGTYIAYGLPKVNYHPGDKLNVKIRKPVEDEFGVCTMMGPTWSWVTITEIK